ncbi:MAG: AMP-dependent synthetase/ligase [Actinomycetota bacterium]
MTTTTTPASAAGPGAAGPRPADAATIVHLFRQQARLRAASPALRFHDEAGWQTITWADYERAVAEVAVGLRAWGLEPGDRVGLLSGNRPEWHIADLAILAAGMVSTPIYATSSSSQASHILNDAGARLCFVENGHQLAKLLVRRGDLPEVGDAVVLAPLEGVEDGFVRGLGELRRAGAEVLDADVGAFDAMVDSLDPKQLATLVYTSGTTGAPKGAMISHANVMATLRSLTSIIDLEPTERFLSFLPLSHITERSVSHFGQVASGGQTWFARSLTAVPEDLRDCRPTLFFAVPRVWEKFQEAIVEKAEEAPAPVRVALQRYLALAEEVGDGSPAALPARDRAAYEALHRSVGRLLRRQLGLDKARMLSSGAAPVHPDLLRWFHGIGLPIAEGYGQTEVTLCTTLNPVGAIKVGTVGKPIPGVEVRIAPDGEILVKAPNVCAGYWGRPDATAELIDPDGWLHTGDLGVLDAEGYLRISGRKKDLIITAYGKNISPSEIETALRHEPLISQAVVVGDDRPYLTALLTLDADAVAQWAHAQGRTMTVEALIDDDDLRAEIAAAVERVNAKHSHAEGIRRWRLLPADLTVAAGELTPTLKVKREVVTTVYADLVEEMYADA